MKLEKTNRGFNIVKFTDRYGEKCTLQKSSLATEDAIWFGIHNPQPKIILPNIGWTNIPQLPETLIAGRMHLTQEQVKELLPIITRFAETGEIGE